MNSIYGTENFGERNENYRTVNSDIKVDTDVCIIGSGAAGSILAAKLSTAGKSVVVLEKGGYFEGEDMNQRDEDMLPLLWKNSGANFTDDLRIAIAQGSTLGGGTAINDAICIPIPSVVRRQWRDLGVEIQDEEWDQATTEVSKEIHVTRVRDDEINLNNLMLKKGCTLLGFSEHYPNDRNCINCMHCGLCHLGCHYETKQEMRVTYIHKALNDTKSKINIFCNCLAEKVTGQSGIVDGVEGYFLDRIGSTFHKIRVNSKIVIIAAGSIGSTYLLLKNSIATDRAGKGLALHPAPFILGDFDFEIRANQGIPISYTLHEFGVTNGVEDGGFLIQAVYLPPLQFSMALPVTGGQFKDLMRRYNHFAMAGVETRDHSNGVITLTDLGFPRVSYSFGEKELETMSEGVSIIAKMWFRLGATRVITSHLNKSELKNENEIPELVNAIKTDPKNFLVGSAHPQGGNRMGSNPDNCVVDSNCKVYGFKNLFICDASVFPTAVGVNPQLSVMALATIISNRIEKRWDDFVSK